MHADHAATEIHRSGPIRYARADRFQPPRLTDPHHPEYTEGAVCPQRPSRLEHVTGPPPELWTQSEDCLHLSVVAPTAPGPHPVLVFLHGGAFVSGSGLSSWYDAERFAAEHHLVVVGVNYRLGPFGWLLADGVSPGNLGLLDQLAALRWVREGIAQFGGDPASVTVVGQSAGGASVGLLLDLAESAALFQQAIIQSGAPRYLLSTPDQARAVGDRLVDLVGDPTAVSEEDLLQGATTVARELPGGTRELVLPPWLPVIGHDPVPPDPMRPSPSSSLRLLVGWNHDEMTAFDYPIDSAGAVTSEVFADSWIAEARRWSGLGIEVQGYRLDWRPEGSSFGATHCVELPLLLGTTAAWRQSPMLGAETDPARRGAPIRAAWAHFARGGTVDREPTHDPTLRWALADDLESLR